MSVGVEKLCMKKIIIITGQTATGKTKLALKKAVEENGELISADSRQAYKYLDITTGKDFTDHNFHLEKKVDNFDVGYYLLHPSPFILHPIKLWLYDVVDPKDYYSSFDFETLALDVIKDILSRGKTPIIIGGSYFYIYHLLYEINSNVPADWELRKELDTKTVEKLQLMLIKLAPQVFESMNQSDRNNPRRLMRRIEISRRVSRVGGPRQRAVSPLARSTDGGINERQDPQIKIVQKLGINNLQIQYIGLRFKNKETLHEAIEKRVEQRLQNEAIEEVKNILKMGYTEKDPGLKTIGYKEIIKFLKLKDLSSKIKDQLSLDWQIHEHQYAKKQNVFMKKDKNIKWLEV